MIAQCFNLGKVPTEEKREVEQWHKTNTILYQWKVELIIVRGNERKFNSRTADFFPIMLTRKERRTLKHIISI